jgi:hypothetical protein
MEPTMAVTPLATGGAGFLAGDFGGDHRAG